MSKSKFPAKDGWIRMELTMTDKTPRSVEEIQNMTSWGKPENYEFGKIEQYGAKIVVIAREKKAEVAA